MPSSGSSKDDVLLEVNHMWSMLDDLYQNDTEAYHKLIEKQKKEGAEFSAAPELHSSICAQTLVSGNPTAVASVCGLTKPNQGLLYINLCSWKRVPAPQNPSQPIPLCAGKLETQDEGGQGPYAVLDVAVNPELLLKCETEMNQLYILLLNFAHEHHNLKSSQRYTPVSSSPRSTTEDLYRRLGFQQWPCMGNKADSGGGIACQTPASLLQKISSLNTEKEEDIFVAHEPTEHKKSNLIQVISSTFAQPQRPEYQLEVRPDTSAAPRRVELTVELPKVSNMSECQLQISKDDVLLEVEDLYHLLLEFPNYVDEDSATAVFNKKKRQLTLSVNILS